MQSKTVVLLARRLLHINTTSCPFLCNLLEFSGILFNLYLIFFTTHTCESASVVKEPVPFYWISLESIPATMSQSSEQGQSPTKSGFDDIQLIEAADEGAANVNSNLEAKYVFTCLILNHPCAESTLLTFNSPASATLSRAYLESNSCMMSRFLPKRRT